MMNLIALSLIATSLVVSGLFSPTPQSNDGGKQEQVIVKGGHRAVVVEYADDFGDGNTKVSISPQDGPNKGPIDEHLSRAAASVAGVAQDVKGKAQEVGSGRDGPEGVRARELICDAYGKCKHKIAGVWGKAKDKAAEVEDVVDKARGAAAKAGHTVEETAEGVRQTAGDKVGEMKGKTGEVVDKARGAAAKAGHTAEETAEGVRRTAREKVGEMKGKAGEVVEETEEVVKEKGEKGKKELSDIAKRGKEVVLDGIWYVCAIGYVVGREAVNSVLTVVQLLGFATAYGIAVWVTFVMSHVLAGILPRQQFGMVQSKIYPVYFKALVGSIGLCLVGHVIGHGGKMVRSKADVFQGYNLMSCLLFVLGNLLFLEPRATKVMFNRMKLEKEEGRGRDHVSAPTRVIDTGADHSAGPTPTPTTTTTTTTAAEQTTMTTSAGRAEEDEVKTKLAKMDNRLKKLNSYSSLLNIMTLMGLTWHLVYLSQRLRASC